MKKRLYKKLVHQKIKAYESLRSQSPNLQRWKKRLVLIHPCADEVEVLQKINYLPEQCESVDGYVLYKDFFIWFEVNGMVLHKGNPCKATYFVSRQYHRSHDYNHHHFIFYVGVASITTEDIAKIILFLESWIDENEKFMALQPVPKKERFGEVAVIYNDDILANEYEKIRQKEKSDRD